MAGTGRRGVAEPAGDRFRRDRTTLLAYGTLAAHSYCLYSLGPILPFLRDELHLSYTLTTLHSSVWVLGTIATGLAYGPLVRRFGRSRVFWLAAAGTAAGALGFTVSHAIGLTLLSAAVLGTAGTVLQTSSIAVLADRHGPHRSRAFVESAVGASAAAVLAPLVLGGLAATPLGWRAGLLPPAVALAVLYAALRALPLPPAAHRDEGRPRLAAAFWPRCVLVALVVGVEFCVVFYAVSLLHASVGVGTTRAAATLGVFYAGELVGRLAGSRGVARVTRIPVLLAAALALTGASLVAFWTAGVAAVAVTALFVTGLGVANLYPLAMALAVAAAPGRTDDATAATQLLVGATVLAAPLALAAAADRVGVVPAFAVAPALLAAAALLLAVTWPARPRPLPDQPAT